jgi:glycosyltransferase involved in cell wall biosynthesis
MIATARPRSRGVETPVPAPSAMERPVRLLHVISTLYAGGTEMLMLRLIRSLDPSRYRVRVAYLRGTPELAAEVEEATGAPPFNARLHGKADPFALARLCAHVRREGFDLVHTHMDLADYYGGLAARLGGARGVVSTKHNADEFRTRPTWKRWPFLALERLAYEASDAVIVVSGGLRDFLETAEHLPRRKMIVIGNGVDPGIAAAAPTRDEARRRLELPGFRPILGSVGRLAPQKGHLHLLDALPAILSVFPEAGLVLAGEGPARGDLEARATRLGIRDRVAFLGHRADVPGVLAALDLFLLPSLWEGMPQALLEAMAMSLPIVAARCVGVVDLVEDGVEALLVPPGDAAALGSAANRLLGDRLLAGRMAGAARRRAVERHSLAAMTARVEALYRTILGRSS